MSKTKKVKSFYNFDFTLIQIIPHKTSIITRNIYMIIPSEKNQYIHDDDIIFWFHDCIK